MVFDNDWWWWCLKKYASVFKSIKAEIEEITGGIISFDKDYYKIWFESENDLPEDNIIDLHLVTIVIFSQYGKYYPQLLLDDALYELQKCNAKKLLMMKGLIIQET